MLEILVFVLLRIWHSEDVQYRLNAGEYQMDF